MFRILILIAFMCAHSSGSGFLKKHSAVRVDNEIGIESPVALLFESESKLQHDRAKEVRKALQHLWSGYKMSAWGADEVRPMSGGQGQDFGEVGMFILDTLDTLWLAGLHEEFEEGQQWVAELQLKPLDHEARSSLFEIIIRGLAGLLSAYALSGKQIFLDKAKMFGDQLLQGFPKADSGHLWPVAYIDVHDPSDAQVKNMLGASYLADVGSNMLEFAYLSEATGDDRYSRAANSVLNKLLALSDSSEQALAPSTLDSEEAKFLTHEVTVGATSDSYFEYLLKRYLQSGCKERHLLLTWKSAMEEMREGLLEHSAPQDLTYITSQGERVEQSTRPVLPVGIGMEHLSCYVGGMLAIASRYVPSEEVEDWWLPTGIEVTRTCYEMYRLSPSGLAPETVYFDKQGMHAAYKKYLLRPETLESLFYLYRITGNTTYRDWSWEIFQAINSKTKTKYGFAAVSDVTQTPLELEDSEATWMGAETLKYALLTQLPQKALSLDSFVLNTEAHPLPASQKCSETSRG